MAERELHGGCHCGAVRFALSTRRDPAELPLRACQCGFCRKHGVRTVSDPEGRARFEVREPALLQRYAFGWKTADYLVCRRCGVYVGAVMREDGRAWAVVVANALDDPAPFERPAEPADYAGEDAAARRRRRRARWTPVDLSAP